MSTQEELRAELLGTVQDIRTDGEYADMMVRDLLAIIEREKQEAHIWGRYNLTSQRELDIHQKYYQDGVRAMQEAVRDQFSMYLRGTDNFYEMIDTAADELLRGRNYNDALISL